MDWNEKSPGVFEKEFGGVEKVYSHISKSSKALGREHWGLYCVCTVEVSQSLAQDVEAKLRASWLALRQKFPSLSVVPGGMGKRFNITDALTAEDWIAETFFVECNSDPDGILASYPLRDLPSIYFFPKLSQIMILASHWRTDGIGMCMLIDCFFTFLATGLPPLVSEPCPADLDRISPSMEDALGALAIDKLGPELRSFARKYIEDHHRNAVYNGGLPYHGDATSPPGNPARTAVSFTPSSTEALVSACKQRNISVTSAVHAALAEAVFALSPDSPEQYTAVISANMRDYLAPPYNNKDHAVQTYVTGITPSVLRGNPFQTRALELTGFYRNWYSEKFARALRLIYQYHSDALFKPKPLEGNAPPPKPPSNILLSSLGVVDKVLASRHGDGANAVAVKDFRFGVSMMTRQMLLYAWTFDGKLTFSVNYNDGYHTVRDVHGILEFIGDVLRRELQIDIVLEK
ncbi:hypothetical protein EKO27_g9827 [Xylaria grammica]|uniref:Condensation domain-containing protein n=1 Tax=Xylaria grammica TaxID=363999 RepID=A0A439CSX3_9PEZI|nr:hypothetical protein EKO27_g9827 [Xylaria grammica]